MKQSTKTLLGFVLGIIAGLFGFYTLPVKSYPFMVQVTEICMLIGAVFLRIIFMIVVPLLLSALMIGVFELGKGRDLGKVIIKSLIFTILLSFLAILIAISLTSILQPGAGVTFDKAELNASQGVLTIHKNVESATTKIWYQYIIELIPQNPVDSAARAFDGEIIPFIFFALIFGYALSQYIPDDGHPLIQVLDAIFNASLKIVDWAMMIAPYAIFAIVFNTTYHLGAGFLQNIAFFVGVVVLGLLIQQFVVYAAFLKFIGRTSPWQFFKDCKDVYLYAFTTSSSSVTLPIALETAEKTLKLPKQISRFVLTCGASANQNGTALFEGVVVLFLAQVYGLNLSIESQFVIILMAVLAGIGTAGVPGGSLPLVAILCVQVGIPVEGMGLILGVDRFLDMCRTTLNVSGDLVIAKLVSSTVDVSEVPGKANAQGSRRR